MSLVNRHLSMHTPVLLQEVIEGLALHPGAIVLDATIGYGGHSGEICRRIGPKGILVGIDEDANALSFTLERLPPGTCRPKLREGNFRNLDSILSEEKVIEVDAVVFDLGISSPQLDSSGRGFTFQKDEPLGMTLAITPRTGQPTAEEIVNEWSEEHLADIIYGFGGERFSRRVAHAIVLAREQKPIKTTAELVALIEGAIPGRRGKIHKATKTFQALRIAANDELGALKEALPKAWAHLKHRGRMVVISFHEHEDRIVKQFFREKKFADEAIIYTKKPIIPSRKEILENPRSRSAKLRIVEKK